MRDSLPRCSSLRATHSISSRTAGSHRQREARLRVVIKSLLHVIQMLAWLACAATAPAQDVTTWHYDNARSGVQSHETVLTPSNVHYSTFGKLFSLPVLGDVYAQPLYLGQYTMSDGKVHNVLIVATAEDYVYAFDADGKNPSTGYLWRKSLLGSGETWMSYLDANGDVDIKPNIGIIGTPVVDRTSGTIYVVAKSKTTSGTVVFRQRLHALNIADGAEKLNGPTLIQASVPGLGDGGTTITFNAHTENQRAALLLAPAPVGSGKAVFIAWASHGDFFVYHGWVLAYDAANIASRVGTWVNTPNGKQGGIWMAGGGLSSDNSGNIFGAGGNGTFDANAGGKDYGTSAFRLSFGTSGLALGDSFTPSNEASLSNADNDMGTSAMCLLPTQSGSVPRLTVTVDKSGTIYLMNRDNLGGFSSSGDSSRQHFSDGGFSIHNSLAFFNNMLYLGVDGGPLEAWAFNPSSELFSTGPQSESSALFGSNGKNGAGSTPSISGNGAANGIVWALDNFAYYNRAPVLHAYDARNLGTELYNSTQAANNRDAGAIAVKFTTPTIANAHVYVGGRNAVTVFGLGVSGGIPAAAPSFSPAGGTYSGAQTVTMSDSTANASIYYSTSGPASTGSTLYTGPIQVATSETLSAVAIAPGFTESAETVEGYTIGTTGGSGTAVSLASIANTFGLYTDGTAFSTGGLDGTGAAYSANLLGTSLNYSGTHYVFGAANQKDVVKGISAPVIPLTAGNFAGLKFLGTGLAANQPSQVFTVTYTDGTATAFTQSMSDWFTPQTYPGEAIALAMPYRNLSTGARDNRTFNLYQYSFALNSAKMVQSLKLPSNANVAVVAVTLTGASSGGTCNAPSTAGVNVCSPVNNSTVNSPVSAVAKATIAGTLARMEVWVDGVKMFTETTSTTLSTSISLAAGKHRFDFYAVNTAATKWEATVYATVP